METKIKKCPICNSTRLSKKENEFCCNRCGFTHKDLKTLKDFDNNENRS